MKPAPSIRHNIAANFAGKAWTSIVSLVFIPIYIRFLGIEAYGLIGIYVSLMALLSVLDMGLSATLSRQLARLSAQEGSDQETRDLVRTLEIIYWGIGALVGAVIFMLAPLIARDWVNSRGVDVYTVTKAIRIMGVVAAFEWPAALYTGGLMGLQRQVLLNVVRAGVVTLQSAGAVLILWKVSPTILAYFTWQIFVSLIQIALLASALWSSLPAFPRGSAFRKSLLVKNWHFAAGMTGISVMTTVLTQLDKLVLSRLLALETFGYYILAFNVANALGALAQPVFSALFPKLSQLVAEKREADLSAVYHKGCRVLSVVVLPAAITVAFFSKEVLSLWIGDPVTVTNTHLLLSLVLIGTALNAVMTLPYALQLAYGWTRLTLYQNVLTVITLVPALLIMIKRYGAVGAAIVWIALNLGYCLIMVPIMHRRLLRREMRQWYVTDVGVPLFLVVGTALMSRTLMPPDASAAQVMLQLLTTGVVALFLSATPLIASGDWMNRGKGTARSKIF